MKRLGLNVASLFIRQDVRSSMVLLLLSVSAGGVYAMFAVRIKGGSVVLLFGITSWWLKIQEMVGVRVTLFHWSKTSESGEARRRSDGKRAAAMQKNTRREVL